MLLFEVHDSPRPGFRLILKQGEAGVPLGYDEETKGDTWLPLGNSVERWLVHPDDQAEEFVLLHAHLEEKSIGFCLTGQSKEEAALEKRALVLVDGSTDREVGVTNIAEAFDRPMPELVTYTEGAGHTRRLYIFKPGDALFISWSAASLDSNRPKRFIISWQEVEERNAEGETTRVMRLLETPVGRPRRNSKQPRKQQKHQRQTPVRPRDLHPE